MCILANTEVHNERAFIFLNVLRESLKALNTVYICIYCVENWKQTEEDCLDQDGHVIKLCSSWTNILPAAIMRRYFSSQTSRKTPRCSSMLWSPTTLGATAHHALHLANGSRSCILLEGQGKHQCVTTFRVMSCSKGSAGFEVMNWRNAHG